MEEKDEEEKEEEGKEKEEDMTPDFSSYPFQTQQKIKKEPRIIAF